MIEFHYLLINKSLLLLTALTSWFFFFDKCSAVIPVFLGADFVKLDLYLTLKLFCLKYILKLHYCFRHGAKSPSRHYCQYKFKPTYKCSELTNDDLKLFNVQCPVLFYKIKNRTRQVFVKVCHYKNNKDPNNRGVNLVVKLNISWKKKIGKCCMFVKTLFWNACTLAKPESEVLLNISMSMVHQGQRWR